MDLAGWASSSTGCFHFLPISGVQMSESHCYICSTSDPAFVCFCKEVLVCRDCISVHLLKEPSPSHKPIPLTRPELIQAQREDAARAQNSQRTDNSDFITDDKRKSMKSLLQHELDRLRKFETSAEEKIEKLRCQWAECVSKTANEILESVHCKTQKMAEEIRQGITDLSDQEMQPPSSSLLKMLEHVGEDYELLTLILDLKPVDISATLRASVSVVVERKEEQVGNPIIYKFFGGSNQVGVFDAKSESFTRTITATVKFFHNSCSCMASNGLIYLTGGSLTGRSRSDAISFDPTSGHSVELQPMQIARRSHSSLCLGNTCYVFGGIMDEELTSLCEKYNGDQDSWVSIARMNERRAYLGCCEYRNRVYIAGGTEQSSCEILDPDTESFQLLVISHIVVEGNCSLVPLSDTILFFHGNFRGEVCRFWPSNNQVAKEKDMCTGNSWSSCAPVVANGCVYMLRAESIFKFNLETSASSYVMRMGKTGKRRFEFD